ncbi:hypothetical protein LINGRAHAP2_LOCUS24306 [Linum grandiflorum]
MFVARVSGFKGTRPGTLLLHSKNSSPLALFIKLQGFCSVRCGLLSVLAASLAGLIFRLLRASNCRPHHQYRSSQSRSSLFLCLTSQLACIRALT